MNNFKSPFSIALIVVFAISIIYFIFIGVKSYLNKDNEILYTDTEIMKEYVTDENLVIDYSMYYTLEKIIQNFIVSLHDEKYHEIINIAYKNLNLNEDKLDDYYINNFKYDILEELQISGYKNMNNLYRVYKVEEDKFICEVNTLDKNTKIGINLINDKKYKIFYLDI